VRAVKGSTFTVRSPRFLALDGETPTDTASTPTVTVTTLDGTALAAPAVTNLADPGLYTCELTPTHTADVDRLAVTWTGVASGNTQVYRQHVDVVAAHYVEVWDLRQGEGLADPVKFPTETLTRVRDLWEAAVDDVIQSSFTTRAAREVLDGRGVETVRTRWAHVTSVRSVTIDGSVETPADFEGVAWGAIRHRSGVFPRPTGEGNVEVVYEYGLGVVPGDLVEELARAMRSKLLSARSGVGPDTLSRSVDGIVERLATPDFGRGRPTGLLLLDSILARYAPFAAGVA
jgi:hypothetical protein